MFTDEEPDFCQREYKSSILTMFMRIDRRFMAKCFGPVSYTHLLEDGHDFGTTESTFEKLTSTGLIMKPAPEMDLAVTFSRVMA